MAGIRKISEIKVAERAAFDHCWYIRSEKRVHMIEHHGDPLPAEEIFDQMMAEMKKLEARYGIDELMPDSEYDVGRADGRLEALRFVLGMDWDEEGILDT